MFKKFLKLERRKAAMVIVVGAIFLPVVFLAAKITPFFGGTALAPILGIILWGIILVAVLPIPIIFPSLSADIIASSIFVKLISTVILVLWWYIISCFAVFIYDKIKNRDPSVGEGRGKKWI